MAPTRPILDELELQLVQRIEIDEDQVLVEHEIPGLEGDFFQRDGRRATRVRLNGVMTGDDVGDKLRQLREKFLLAHPVPFVSDITVSTRVDQVLIGEMAVKEVAGKTQRFEYAIALHEYIEPPPNQTEPPEPPPEDPVRPIVDPVDQRVGTLEVEVIVEGEPEFDFSGTRVTVRGTQEGGTPFSRELADRTDNIWTDEAVPVSQEDYLVEAITSGVPPLTGSASAAVRAGEVTRVTIVLRPASNLATTFLVHFRFDSAFVEPCMRQVLSRAAAYAGDHADEKMLIVGHTDRAGTEGYNQALSERRARAVHGFLTYGRDRTTAFNDWNTLRQTRTGSSDTSVQDNWGAWEYQQILQDLNFYAGRIDGDHGPATDDAVRAYRCHKGLPDGTQVDDEVWAALIDDYLGQDDLAVPADRFFENCDDTQILRWLGCGEEDPKDRRTTAFRPSRRVEVLFVRAPALPCEVPIPVTFNTDPPGPVDAAWCLDNGNAGARCCFVSPVLAPGTNDPQPCPTDPTGPWCRESEDPGTITVRGTIFREQPDGSLVPAPNQPFVLIAPDGTYKDSEQANGEPRPARTGSGSTAGTFEFTGLPKGFYSLEVQDPAGGALLVRLEEADGGTVRGAMVCKALRSDSDGLNVVILNAPAHREIVLPAVAHVMTALHPTERTVRTCTDGIGNEARQQSALTDQEVRDVFEEANRIWQPARIRFELVDIVREAYAFRTECEVDEGEFEVLLQRCAYPEAVNVFFVGDLDGNGEAGLGLSPEGGAALGIAGCAVGDRFQTTILGPPVNTPVDATMRAWVLAHELGHYMNLEDVEESPANADRLMLAQSSTGLNRRLDPSEIDAARASEGATDDCVPLTLRVEGATQVGGSLSHQFLFVQHPVLIDPFDVTIDADIPDRLLTTGTLVMTGGNAGATPLQRTVPKSTKGVFEIVATYTPHAGGDPVEARVVVTIATLSLRVDGATPVPGVDNSVFAAQVGSSALVRIFAELDPAPFCVPRSMPEWTGGAAFSDPLMRMVLKDRAEQTEVTVTIAGETRRVVIRVYQLSLMRGGPFPTTSNFREIIGGIPNESRQNFSNSRVLHGTTSFQILIELPGLSEDTITLDVTSRDPSNGTIERIELPAHRLPGTEEYLAVSLYPIPLVTLRSSISFAQPKDIEIVRTQAGGKLIVHIPETHVGANSTDIRMRGPVVYVFAQAFRDGTDDAGVTEEDIRSDIQRANRVWAQAGIEVKEREIRVGVQDPGGLLDLDTSDRVQGRSEEERRLTGRHPDCATNPASCPVRSATSTDLNVYYLRNLGLSTLGLAYEPETVIAIEGGAWLRDFTLAHEIGHHLIVNWPCRKFAEGFAEHYQPDCEGWPFTNVLAPSSIPFQDQENVAISQANHVRSNLSTLMVVFEG